MASNKIIQEVANIPEISKPPRGHLSPTTSNIRTFLDNLIQYQIKYYGNSTVNIHPSALGFANQPQKLTEICVKRLSDCKGLGLLSSWKQDRWGQYCTKLAMFVTSDIFDSRKEMKTWSAALVKRGTNIKLFVYHLKIYSDDWECEKEAQRSQWLQDPYIEPGCIFLIQWVKANYKGLQGVWIRGDWTEEDGKDCAAKTADWMISVVNGTTELETSNGVDYRWELPQTRCCNPESLGY
jgi:hypothetical protein